MKKDYAEAYSEVLEVLKYIDRNEYSKIPKSTIQLLESNCNENSNFTYNIALPFDKQNISNDAKLILAIIYRNCWISQEEKQEILDKQKEYLSYIESKKKSADEIFENRNENIVEELQKNNYLPVKQKWYQKILSNIRRILP